MCIIASEGLSSMIALFSMYLMLTYITYVSSLSSAALEAANLKWPCYECDKKFRTSAQLQKHLSVHDDTLHENPEDSVDMFDVSVDGSLKTNGRSAQRRRRGWSPKKSRVRGKVEFFD